MLIEKLKAIIICMSRERGVRLKHISEQANVSYTILSKWTNNREDFTSDNIRKLENFVKEYHFVNSIDEVLEMFNKK